VLKKSYDSSGRQTNFLVLDFLFQLFLGLMDVILADAIRCYEHYRKLVTNDLSGAITCYQHIKIIATNTEQKGDRTSISVTLSELGYIQNLRHFVTDRSYNLWSIL
jgi:hypothetical protein